MKKLKFIIYTKSFGTFIYYFINFYCLTLRFKVHNEKKWQQLLKQGKTIILCSWHQQFFSAIPYGRNYSKYNGALMISKSKDGDLIARVANKTGWHTARGSSSRSGKEAMNEMIDHLNKFKFGLHIVDGPTGPIGKVKSGVIRMANKANAIIVPMYTYSENAWFFNSWDKFMLPKPFAKVNLVFGKEILFKPAKTSQDFEIQRQNLEKIMLKKYSPTKIAKI